MMHGTWCVHWTHDVQDVVIGYRYFPRIFLVEKWSSISYLFNLFNLFISICYIFLVIYLVPLMGLDQQSVLEKTFSKSDT